MKKILMGLFSLLFFLSGCKSQEFETLTADQVVAEIKNAGLEIVDPKLITANDNSKRPQVAEEDIAFQLPSVCEGCYGHVFSFSNKKNMRAMKAYYAKTSMIFFPAHLYEKENILITLTWLMPADDAQKYETVLNNIPVNTEEKKNNYDLFGSKTPTITLTPPPTSTPTLVPIPDLAIIGAENANEMKVLYDFNLSSTSSIAEITWSADNTKLFVLTDDMNLWIFNTSGQIVNKMTFASPYEGYRGYAIDNKNLRVAVAGEYEVKIYDALSGLEVNSVPIKKRPLDMSFSSDGSKLILSMYYGLFIWDLNENKLDSSIDQSREWYTALFSRDEKYIYGISEISDNYENFDPKFSIFDIGKEQFIANYSVEEKFAKYVISIDNLESSFVTFSPTDSNSIKLRKLDGGNTISTFEGANPQSLILDVKLNYDGSVVIITDIYEDSFTGRNIPSTRMINTKDDSIIKEFPNVGWMEIFAGGSDWGFYDFYTPVSFSPDGKMLAIGDQFGNIQIWGVLQNQGSVLTSLLN